ncbi:MAG: tRNA pseudouridine synthase A [Planctomycetales bacterium]|nr:tRNA pseudouridine synthase A [bacterium]UNM07913.1 MAG: tRNA pseudouridine synthase A [Planctomycetales bacterium]
MTGTRRIAMRVRYDGTDFHGSQLQSGQRTVSGTLTTELSSLLGQDVHLLWAGRTDSGVHSDGNVCAFDAQPAMPVDNLAVMLNDHLPADLRITGQWEAAAEFHPRFDALMRTYTYRIWRGSLAPVDRYRYVLEHGSWLELCGLRRIAGLFSGEHCFRAFCKQPEEGDACMCTLEEPVLAEDGPEVRIVIRGNRFLRHMICRLVGAMIAACEGRLAVDDVTAALQAGGGELRLNPAPARGLTLTWVDYEGLPRDGRN